MDTDKKRVPSPLSLIHSGSCQITLIAPDFSINFTATGLLFNNPPLVLDLLIRPGA